VIAPLLREEGWPKAGVVGNAGCTTTGPLDSRQGVSHAPRVRRSRRIALFCLVAALIIPGSGGAQAPLGGEPSLDYDQPFMEAYREAEPITVWPIKKVLHEIPELKKLKPAADQSALPATLERAAQRLQTFWADFQNTSSLETIEESRQLEGLGTNMDHAVQQFRYLMLTDPDNPLQVREYRTDLEGRERNSDPALSGFVQTTGFTSLPLIFGAEEQRLTDFRDLGVAMLHDHACRAVAFAQHVDPSAFSRWHIEDQRVPILIQGVAWIDPADGQVLQIRSDLLAPQPRVALRRATTVVTFAPVQFHTSAGAFWLPREVKVDIDLDRYNFVNRHIYSDYQVFTVSTGQKTQRAANP
jgi:hypothetical protein